ncbi:MAG: HAMP domain-containing sensor histidine kinase [Alphaproteobacteria bacterium]
MRPISPLQSSVFRLTLLYAAAFGASALALLGFLYVRTGDVLDSEADAAITAEAEGLGHEFQGNGLPGLVNEIRGRLADERGRNTLYLLINPAGRPVAGNLTGWPREIERDGPWVLFELQRIEAGGAEPARARARVFDLPGGFRVLVGRDLRERVVFDRAIIEALLWVLVATVTLGLGGGYVLARRVLGRIAAIERTAATIMAGDLSGRIPLRARDDEFDRLGARLNAMLAEIDRLLHAMREVADNVAHDLRRPLTRLRGRLEDALRGLAEGDPRRESIERALIETDAVIATFNALLTIASAEATLPESMADIDLGVVVTDAVELYRPLAEEKSLALALDAGGSVQVRGHGDLLAQAVANLLDNAIKYTSPGGHVTVSVAATKSGAAVTVADDGPGIAEAERGRAVERFVRLDSSRTTPGSGLGLCLVHAVARLHGGALTLEDNAPGLRATLTVPLATNTASGDAPARGPHPSTSSG